MANVNFEYNKDNLAKLSLKKFDYIIPIGDSCSTTAIIKDDLKLRKFSFPFDWIKSTPNIIYDILLENFKDFCEDKYPMEWKHKNWINYYEQFPLSWHDDNEKNIESRKKLLHNKYGVTFTHMAGEINGDQNKENSINTLERRCDRLIEILNNPKNNVLFLYIPIASWYYKENRDLEKEFNEYNLKIENLLTEKYICNFKMLVFNLNKEYMDTKNILNIKYILDEKYFDEKYVNFNNENEYEKCSLLRSPVEKSMTNQIASILKKFVNPISIHF